MQEKSKAGAIVRLVLSVVIFFMLLSCLLFGIMKKDGKNFFINFGFGGLHYSDEDKYIVGNTSFHASELEEIHIDWVDGQLNVVPVDNGDDKILISEAGEQGKEIPLDNKIRSRFENGILTVHYCSSSWFSFGHHDTNKTAYISIPKQLAHDIKIIEVDNVSADVYMDNLTAKEVEIDNVSGEVSFDGAVTDFDMETVSGNCKLKSTTTPNDISVDAVSGDTFITVPAQSDFYVETDSVSGELLNEFPTISKNSNNKWEFDSVSGDVEIRKLSN